jgi:hypothetical protein
LPLKKNGSHRISPSDFRGLVAIEHEADRRFCRKLSAYRLTLSTRF